MDEALVRILADHELKHQEIRSIEDLSNQFEPLKIAVNSLSSMVTHSTNNTGTNTSNIPKPTKVTYIAFIIATGKGKAKYLDLTGSDRQRIFKLVGEEARARDERYSVTDRYSGLWIYNFAVHLKWKQQGEEQQKEGVQNWA
ncbi:hypothetical protein G6F37_005135 [Rhizopus arrhizus]|nr:hypothetical protein G6F38_002796 [Rhizopus arrhizus]KAG1159181.1 hypothetical protein G6F37_005135 [Rhizopus arrhizus]